MKRFLSACARGAFYVLILLGSQLLVQSIYFIAYCSTDPLFLIDTISVLMNASDHILTQSALLILITDLLAIGLYLLTAPMRKRSLTVHLSLYPLDRRMLLPSVLLGFFANLALSLLLGILPFPQSWWESYESSAAIITTEFSFTAILAQAVIAPFAEELCFRGLLYTRLRSGMPKLLACIFSSLVFGLVHGTAIWFFYAFLLGLVMAWLFQRTGSLWASILFHMAFNGIIFLLVLLPEASLPALSVLGCIGCAGCAVWLMRLTRQTAPQETLICL